MLYTIYMDSVSVTFLNSWINAHPALFALIILWSLVWKGFGLWRAAERQQRYWFIAMLVLNTAGLLEIVYLFLVARKYKVEIVEN